MTNAIGVVERFGDPISAHVALARLGAEGIHAWIEDEHFVAVNPLLCSAVGGVKVVVPAAELAAARAVLVPKHEADALLCPKCGATSITRHQLGRVSAFLTILLLGVPIGRARAKLRCEACRHAWRG